MMGHNTGATHRGRNRDVARMNIIVARIYSGPNKIERQSI